MPYKDKNNPKRLAYLKKYRKTDNSRRAKEKYDISSKRLLTQQNLHLKRTYNITLEDYQQLHTNQGGVCVICGGVEEKKMLSVDHNHQTGKVRGLLCQRCNTGIGMFKEDVLLLEIAIEYLKNY